MRIHETVNSVHAAFPIDEAMGQLAELTTFDRYQASKGIESAADLVADLAERAGLTDVKIHRFLADGERHWWTFNAPLSWTPLLASLEIIGANAGDSSNLITAYPSAPFSIAINSAPTPAEGMIVPLVEMTNSTPETILRGSLAVVNTSNESLATTITRAEQAAAVGLVANVRPAGSQPTDESLVGRIEFPSRSKLFGFSLSRQAINQALCAAQCGRKARAVVVIDRSAIMPVVEGRLPGVKDEEILLLAHLCHPRPGANDNGSGIVALLGIAQALHSLIKERGPIDPVRGIRFLWGPEFVGSAAYLHHLVGQEKGRLPIGVINLDMVGENQHRCGSPLILERSPDHVPSFFDALAEYCIECLPQEGYSYSGAVPTATWTWRSTPFVGASDHALFADRSIARPAIQLGHWPDRFNHTSHDTLDKVSSDELRRAATIAGASALFVASANSKTVPYLQRVVARWGARQLNDVVRVGLEATHNQPGIIDPHSTQEIGNLFWHAAEVVSNAIKATATLCTDESKSGRTHLAGWLRRQAREQAKLLPLCERRQVIDLDTGTIERLWSGPFNLRAVLEDAPASEASWLRSELSSKRGAYAVILALALAIDDRSPRQTVMRRAAYSSRLKIDVEVANRLIEILKMAGWATETSK